MRPSRLPALLSLALLLALVVPVTAAGDEMPAPPAGGPDGKAPEAAPPEDEINDEEDGPEDFVNRVNVAITKGVEWLKKKQRADGSYGPIVGNASYAGGDKGSGNGQQPAGPTALAMYALLKCKVPVNDPVVQKGFAWLRKHHKMPGDSYEASTLLLAVTATADPFKKLSASTTASEKEKIKLTGEYRAWAQALKDHLLKKRVKGGGWRYTPGKNPPPGDQDLSSTQLVCLALFAADRCGIKVDSAVWNDMITFAMKQQEADGPKVDRAIEANEPKVDSKKKGDEPADPAPAAGSKPQDRARGHAYLLSDNITPDEGAATGGMTACGLGTIMMARFILMHRPGDKLWEARDKAAVQQSVYDSAAWLNYNWSPLQNPKKQKINVYNLYYLYCVERAFDMIGNRRLGNHFWYVEMGERLLGAQKTQGFWKTGTTHDPEDTLDTCFALLFLKRATRGGIPYPSITGGSEEPPVDRRGER